MIKHYLKNFHSDDVSCEHMIQWQIDGLSKNQAVKIYKYLSDMIDSNCIENELGEES